MTLKYRINYYTFPFAEPVYISAYKILGIWMKINYNQRGCFLNHSGTFCETLTEAEERISLHKRNMERAGDWAIRGKEKII